MTVGARYDAASDAALLAGFPFPHTLDLTVSLRTDLLTWSVTLTATGDVAVPVSFGWHPYLRLPGIPRDGLGADAPARSRGAARRAQHPDRADAPGAVHRRARSGTGRSTISSRCWPIRRSSCSPAAAARCGCDSTRATAAPRCTPRRAADFICFEPMTAATDALRRGGAGLRLVAPGDALTASWSLLVEGRPGA